MGKRQHIVEVTSRTMKRSKKKKMNVMQLREKLNRSNWKRLTGDKHRNQVNTTMEHMREKNADRWKQN